MEASYCQSKKRAFVTTLFAAGVVAAAWAGLSPEASAEKHRPRKFVQHRTMTAHERQVFVPRAIGTRDRAVYARFQSGRVYYAPHRHYHVRYSFPVYVNGVVRYRPYSYCGDHVFLSGAVTLPRLAIGVQVGPVWSYRYSDPGYDVYDDYGGPAGCYQNDCDDDDGYRYDDYGYRYDQNRYRYDNDDDHDGWHDDDDCDD